MPNNYLSFFNFKKSTILSYNYKNLLIFQKYLIKLLNNKNKDKITENFLLQNYFNKIFNYKKKNFEYSKFTINFLRIQKRYNKRRYSKVRVVSRPSFFSGISLCSILTGMF